MSSANYICDKFYTFKVSATILL